jgi:hypothetical protein
LQLWKNSCNLISNGPNLLVWVTHGKFELEGWIRKLFIVKPRATVYRADKESSIEEYPVPSRVWVETAPVTQC